jgi:chemotaxis protein MotA
MITTILGLLCSIAIIMLAIVTQSDPAQFLNWKAMLITLGGTIAATLTYFSSPALDFTTNVLLKMFKRKEVIGYKLIEIIVDISKEIHFKDMLEIMNREDIKDLEFLKKGLGLIADDVPPKHLKEILVRQSRAITSQYRVTERVFAVAGGFAPMFGMIGTILGLIAMLGKISTPEAILPAMGIALVTTLYGLLLSAIFFIPFSGKIRDLNHFETNYRNLMIEGILAIQAKENPHVIYEKLISYLNPWELKDE